MLLHELQHRVCLLVHEGVSDWEDLCNIQEYIYQSQGVVYSDGA